MVSYADPIPKGSHRPGRGTTVAKNRGSEWRLTDQEPVARLCWPSVQSSAEAAGGDSTRQRPQWVGH